MSSEPDARLVERATEGDQSAFVELVCRHGGTVYSICYRLVGNAVDAEDLAQEAFLRLHRSLGRVRPGADLKPWLYRLTTNICLDALRQNRQATLPLDALVESGREPSVERDEELPEAALLRREGRLDVQRALLRIPAGYRAALVLRYLEGLSYRDVADALGVPLSTVETRIFRAKRLLAPLLTPDVAIENVEGRR